MLRHLLIFFILLFSTITSLFAQSIEDRLTDIESIHSEMFTKSDGTNYRFMGVVGGLAYIAGDNLAGDSSNVWVVDPWSFDRLGIISMPVRTPRGRTRIEKIFGFQGRQYLLFSESLFGEENIAVYFARITSGFLLTDSVMVSEIPSEYLFGFYKNDGVVDVLISPDQSLLSIYFTVGKEAPYSRFVNFNEGLEKVNTSDFTLASGKHKIIPEQFFLDNSGVIYGFGISNINRRSHTHYATLFKLVLDEVLIEPIPELSHKGRASIAYFKKSNKLSSSRYVIAENDTVLHPSSPPRIVIADPYHLANSLRFEINFATVHFLTEEAGVKKQKSKKSKKKKASYIIQIDDSLSKVQAVNEINAEVKRKKLFLEPIGLYNDPSGNYIVILSVEGHVVGINPKGDAEELNYSGKILVVKVSPKGDVLDERIIEREYVGGEIDAQDALFVLNDNIYFLLHDAVTDALYSEMVDIHIQGIEDFSFQRDPGYTVIDENNVFGPRMSRSNFFIIDEQDYVQFRGRLSPEDAVVKGYLSILHFNF